MVKRKVEPSEMIAAFDLDYTLIKTKSGRVFPVDNKDWELLFPDQEMLMLKELVSKGFNIVVFSNQSGIEHGHVTEDELVERVLAIELALGVPMSFFLATRNDNFRKPSPDMWNLFVETVNGGMDADRSRSFFVGDAAGREAGWRKRAKRDFSCADRKFAINVGLPFFTPEEYFLGVAPTESWSWGDFHPKRLKTEKIEERALFKDQQEKELVVFVGMPASGKTTFFHKHFSPRGYVHINRDSLKTKAKCVAALEAALSSGKSAVVDNTNPKVEDRKVWTTIAKKYELPVRCFLFSIDRPLSEHLNHYRKRMAKDPKLHIPSVAYNYFEKAFVTPDSEEGFDVIETVTFVPSFANEEEQNLFFQFQH